MQEHSCGNAKKLGCGFLRYLSLLNLKIIHILMNMEQYTKIELLFSN